MSSGKIFALSIFTVASVSAVVGCKQRTFSDNNSATKSGSGSASVGCTLSDGGNFSFSDFNRAGGFELTYNSTKTSYATVRQLPGDNGTSILQLISSDKTKSAEIQYQNTAPAGTGDADVVKSSWRIVGFGQNLKIAECSTPEPFRFEDTFAIAISASPYPERLLSWPNSIIEVAKVKLSDCSGSSGCATEYFPFQKITADSNSWTVDFILGKNYVTRWPKNDSEWDKAKLDTSRDLLVGYFQNAMTPAGKRSEAAFLAVPWISPDGHKSYKMKRVLGNQRICDFQDFDLPEDFDSVKTKIEDLVQSGALDKPC